MFKMRDTSLCNFSTSSHAFSTGMGLKLRYLYALVIVCSLFNPSRASERDKLEIFNIVQILHHNDTTTGRTRDCKVSDGRGNSRTRSLEPKTRLIGKVWIFIHILVCILLTDFKFFLSWPLFANIYAIYDLYVHFERNPNQIWCIFSEKLLVWVFGMAKNHGVLGGAKKKKIL